MGYFKYVYLLPLYYLLPLLSGQKLEIDNNGAYFYIEGQGSELVKRSVCFIENSNISQCAEGQFPILVLKASGPAPSPAAYRTTYYTTTTGYTDFYYVWPTVQANPVPLRTVTYPFITQSYQQPGYNYQAVVIPTAIWPLENSNTRFKIIVKKKGILDDDDDDDDDDIYITDNDKAFKEWSKTNLRFRRSSIQLPEIIPLNVTGCMPIKNMICRSDDVSTYEAYLTTVREESVKYRKSSYKSHKKYNQYRTNSQTFESRNENKNIETQNKNIETENSEGISNEISDSDDYVDINTKEYAQEIAKGVVKKLRAMARSKCPLIVKKLDVEIYQSEEQGKPKLEAVLDVNLDNPDEEKSAAESSGKYSSGRTSYYRKSGYYH